MNTNISAEQAATEMYAAHRRNDMASAINWAVTYSAQRENGAPEPMLRLDRVVNGTVVNDPVPADRFLMSVLVRSCAEALRVARNASSTANSHIYDPHAAGGGTHRY